MGLGLLRRRHRRGLFIETILDSRPFTRRTKRRWLSWSCSWRTRSRSCICIGQRSEQYCRGGAESRNREIGDDS